MRLKKICLIILITLIPVIGSSQEGLPIYSDYLTDNYYLLHPSMAGIANCAKIRLTARQQWFGIDDAPNLQTLSAHGRIGDSQSAVGAIVYDDANGFHSTTGAQVTYAHHLLFSRNEVDLNMLSFGLSVGFNQYKLDESSFLAPGEFDQLIAGIEQSATNFNIDVGFSYHFLNFYAIATAKNILENEGINFNEQGFAFNNLRSYLVSVGNVFHKYGSDWSFEPSLLYFYRDATRENSIDVNAKVYREMDFGKIWGGLSYRRSLDGAEFLEGNDVSSQKLQIFTPFVGVDFDQLTFAYTFSYQANTINFNTGGFHQITLGYNFNCKREKYDCDCPAIN
ncbi:PorP/SprF family type IX secretion system membrane protein [Winogradskyella immobilis]|uniref:Type IX secretion system membrane protein PorP/SprF n=1 Tax=Winogradskyella immobilis TaxID=2816852 RepID=A0ABS8EIK6_9FLAO|nr:type IX secretion system membrane protein PorP/SprF [Winogradskyella immobilis]MCC1483031.1 type IX secretion system membrane protein PorP/SprF [Winogradskyella immobilis]MCG0015126.1 type IX secretion system membrane protein PorP/SprF [Winogradskyella immobilis]